MPKNVNQTDRLVRVGLFVILAVLGLTQLGSNAFFGIILIVIGLVLLATAYMGFCPIYAAFGFSTNKKS
ncbi:MAG: DUF2892 domain-containing protein [bacterium]|nr:DUF2892 domain-containing protein [bacterium]